MKKYEQTEGVTLVLGGTGKTGRRVIERLTAMGVSTRIGSRYASTAFDWKDPSNWGQVLDKVRAVYISFAPDLAVPGAAESIKQFVDVAIDHGVKRVVLLSGRGEEEAQRCEGLIQREELEWTVVRASWFAQNFSEGAFYEMVINGEVLLPAGDVREPFVDVEDIADVAVAALTETGHSGQIYEVTGPRLMTFAKAVETISQASGRKIQYRQIPLQSFIQHAKESGIDDDLVWLLEYLFSSVLDGRNEYLTDGVRRAIGREPIDFLEYAKRITDEGLWRASS